mgnify:CR=1 FL=1
MKAVGKKIVVEIKLKEIDTGGIHIPEASKKKDVELYIAEVGPDITNKAIKKGARVVVDQRKAVPLKVEETEYMVVEESDLLVIL